MADRRRAGCGCIPLILLFVFVIPLLMNVGGALLGEDLGFELGTGVVRLVVGVAVVVLLWAIFRRVARNREAEDVLADGSPTSTGSGSRRPPRSDRPSPETPAPAPSRPRPAPASSRPAPQPEPSQPGSSKSESSRTDSSRAEEPETRVLRQRLAEAVSDISSGRRYTDDERGRPLTSSEMIERAKRSIADWEHRR